MQRKFKIIFACWATVIAIAILFSMFMVLLGMEDKIETFFYIHFTAGIVVVFLIFWPLYSKWLK